MKRIFLNLQKNINNIGLRNKFIVIVQIISDTTIQNQLHEIEQRSGKMKLFLRCPNPEEFDVPVDIGILRP